MRCEDDVVRVCNESGTGSFSAFDCGARGETCVIVEGTGTCVPNECEPTERGCLDVATEFTCADDGSARVSRTCPWDEACLEDRCVPQESCIELSESSLEFMDVPVGTGRQRASMLSNCGLRPARISSLQLSDSAFSFGPGTEITPFEVVTTQQIDLAFTPSVEGRVDADFVVTTQDGVRATSALLGSDIPPLGGDIQVQLTWNNTADLDLHLVRGDGVYRSSPYDCYWLNMNPDWGAPGELHNPTLDFDDSDGYGPETIRMPTTEQDVEFNIFVNAHELPEGPTFATVTVFFNGEEVGEMSAEMHSVGDVWPAGEFTVLSGLLDIVLREFDSP